MSQCELMPVPAPSVVLHDGRPATTSLEIAKFFGKRHTDVLRDINNMLPNCPEKFSQRNFASANYLDDQAKNRPMFIIFKDGFILLVMGYTGKKALVIKLAYIEAFNALEAELHRQREVNLPSSDILASAQQAELKLIVDAKVGMLPKPLQRKAYAEIWTRFNRHFHIAEYKQLPCSRMDEARDFLLSMQVNAGKIEALPQAALPVPCAAYPVIDEKPFLEFIEEIQAAHEEVDRILSRLHHSVFTLSWKVAEALEQRADIRLYLVPDMLSENTLRGYLHQSVYHDVKKALTAPGRQLEQYSNPGYSLLGIVRQLNGNGRA